MTKIYYNPHINKFFKPDPTATAEYLLGIGYYWFYIGEL
jgi:hypothetical protein